MEAKSRQKKRGRDTKSLPLSQSALSTVEREGYLYLRALSEVGIDVYLSVHPHCGILDDTQSQSRAVALSSCLVDTVEASEDSRLLLSGDAYSVVLDDDGDGIGGDCAARHDFAICGQILETW